METPESVQLAESKIINKLYVSNVINRLRQIDMATENDKKRWIYELLQNAKDSIVQDISRSSVEIWIDVTDEFVEFKHNGSPFTGDAIFGLLYKYSEGKENTESTGRFGTGFQKQSQ
jgi:hypothetical protein